MEKTHPAIKLMDAIEDLFRSGADETQSEEELLDLLTGLRWSLMVHSIIHNAVILYEYTVEGSLRYRGAKLLCEGMRAFRLYQAADSAQTVDGVTHQRSMELWISEDMELFIASCFRVSSGKTSTEYRTWKGKDWLSTELEISFPMLAQSLKAICELASCSSVPFYETSCV